ncbi:hypothetical protein B14911_07083 [Bacillus sp. NRRL B-14911]|nr:hypothetical protein B14911_07083 [Bacillus sp. NRRL B-14911]
MNNILPSGMPHVKSSLAAIARELFGL